MVENLDDVQIFSTTDVWTVVDVLLRMYLGMGVFIQNRLAEVNDVVMQENEALQTIAHAIEEQIEWQTNVLSVMDDGPPIIQRTGVEWAKLMDRLTEIQKRSGIYG